MQIMINHLTRMQPGLMCTAGIDLATGNHVRPVMGRPLPVNLLARNGGPFGLGRVLELGDSTFCGRFPEIEDRKFNPDSVTVVYQAEYSELYEKCNEVAERSLRNLFGPELVFTATRWGGPGTACIEEHHGLHSLGCYWASKTELKILETERGPKVRMLFEEEGHPFSVAVTDIRMYCDDHITPERDAIRTMQELVASQPELLVAIGLSRPHRATDVQQACHWLQINNLFPEPGPTTSC